ncbi:ATPase H+ transporting accessory protein 1 like a [Lampris incognitus]|uniref:ATPase H+ transporting accessory protein 1 like a n=1 Tax=Lampris incognitus TaxID=2546036 RepID=UPI0024B53A3C|nr:ATPase H+ transporting accessory protein 1 like a [Lampris incognitus]
MDGAGEWRREVLFPAEDPIRRLLQPYGWPLLHSPETSRRKLLQTPGAAVPFSPLKVVSNGKPCILFRSRKLAIRYQNSSLVDLTERTFSAENPVDTKGSVCTKDKATLVMKFGDVEDLRGLSIRIQMSSTFYESAGQTWFSVDSVSLHYNWSQEARFNVTEVYAPSTSSYHCQHVSSLQRYDTLLLPSSASDNARHWHVTFTDFQIQAFNVASGKFAPASDCATFFTPAILMGLITSLILLLVLAYALHMVIHLKHIDHYDEHKTTVYFPRSPEQAEPCSVANVTEKNTL